MNEQNISRDTVVIDDSVHHVYQRLTEGNNPVETPFRTMKDVFMWAVCLGYQRGERKPIFGKRVTIFRWAQFSPQTDIPLLKSFAIVDKQDVNILLEQEDILTIAEEYANAGIDPLYREVLGVPGQPLWNVTNLPQE